MSAQQRRAAEAAVAQKRRSTSSFTSSSDISSLCDQMSLAQLPSESTQPSSSSMFFTSTLSDTTSTTTDSTTAQPLPERAFNTGQDVQKIYEEPMRLYPTTFRTPRANGLRVEKAVTVCEFPDLGINGQHQKRGERGSNNPWRRFGALRRIYEVGGMMLVGDRKKRNYSFVTAESTPPPPPIGPEMTLNWDQERSSLLDELDLGAGRPAALLAHDAALFIDELISEERFDDSLLDVSSVEVSAEIPAGG
ncbi:unnamed protein product, partial [Mesorhabditis spiculigera]